MSGSDVVIVSAYRTAIGSFNGSLAQVSAPKLGEAVIRKTLEATKVTPSDVSEVIMGNILTAGLGMNTARQAALNAGISIEAPAWTINQVCGSGLRAVALGYDAIRLGNAKIVIAGGQENMSASAHAIHLRGGYKMGNATMVDTMINDGLTDVFNNYHMGITAENIADKFAISKDEQDAFALSSQNKAEAAQKAGKFNDEIVPVKIMVKREEQLFASDEFIRHGAKLEDMSKLKSAFKKEGTVSAANASGINDGAAVVMLMSRDEAAKRGLEILATIKSFAHAGVDPTVMGTGPIPASKLALEKAGWSVADLDLIEANEAFAAQAICVNKQMGWDVAKVNVNGGAIALGHPIGASGCRILVTLLHELKRSGAKRGLATLCVGGGMGVAMCVERE